MTAHLPIPDEGGVYRYGFGARISPCHGLKDRWRAYFSNGAVLTGDNDEPYFFKSPQEAHECIVEGDVALHPTAGGPRRGLILVKSLAYWMASYLTDVLDDTPINGGDLVEYLGMWVRTVRATREDIEEMKKA